MPTSSGCSQKGDDRLEWSAAILQAFQASKKALTDATYLAHPLPGASLSLAVDASATHVGAGLHQRRQGSAVWEPLGFFSKKLEPVQTRYSAFNRELLACITSIRHFRYMLEGRRFVLLTDHKPLTFALGRISEPWTARQARHLSLIGQLSPWRSWAAQTDIADLQQSSSLQLRALPSGHCCQIPSGLLGQFSQKNSAAGEKIRP